MESNFKIGDKVQTMKGFSGVPKFTEGIIVDDYGTGVLIAWDLSNRRLPENKTPEEIAKMKAFDPNCPLIDGFDKDTELCELVKIIPKN